MRPPVTKTQMFYKYVKNIFLIHMYEAMRHLCMSCIDPVEGENHIGLLTFQIKEVEYEKK